MSDQEIVAAALKDAVEEEERLKFELKTTTNAERVLDICTALVTAHLKIKILREEMVVQCKIPSPTLGEVLNG